jgi:hypothetical protein
MGKHEQGLGSLSTQHLWVVADRAIWTTSLYGAFRYFEHSDSRSISRERGVGAQSVYRFYVEDRVSLSPALDLRWRRTEDGDGRRSESWEWQLNLSLTYDLENMLF